MKHILYSFLLSTLAASGTNPEDFSVPAATAKSSFSLKDARGKYVALHFLLKTECPLCLKHTRDYFTQAEKLTNVVQVFLKPDTEKEIQAWAGKLSADELAKYPIYRDANAELAKAYGIPDGYAFHGQSVHFPALVLLGPDGKEVFRHVGKGNSDRYSFSQLAEKMKEIAQP